MRVVLSPCARGSRASQRDHPGLRYEVVLVDPSTDADGGAGRPISEAVPSAAAAAATALAEATAVADALVAGGGAGAGSGGVGAGPPVSTGFSTTVGAPEAAFQYDVDEKTLEGTREGEGGGNGGGGGRNCHRGCWARAPRLGAAPGAWVRGCVGAWVRGCVGACVCVCVCVTLCV